MIKLVKFTICGIVLGIASILVFDLGYLVTMLVTNNRNYSVNAGLAANAFIIIGIFIDMLISSTSNRKEIVESDLTPKGFKTVLPVNRIVLNNEQDVLNYAQSKGIPKQVKNTPRQKEVIKELKKLAEKEVNNK